MKKHLYFLLSLFFIAVIVKAQEQAYDPKEYILWNELYKLRWDDFQGSAAENAAGDAATSVQIKAQPYMVKNKVRYNVYALFNKKKSWSRDQSAQLMVHEQLHFDLAEVFARKIRKKIRELSTQKVNDVKVYNQAIQILLQESNEVDQLYDLETLHGALDQKQAAWAKKIHDELVALKNYKRHKQVINPGS